MYNVNIYLPRPTPIVCGCLYHRGWRGKTSILHHRSQWFKGEMCANSYAFWICGFGILLWWQINLDWVNLSRIRFYARESVHFLVKERQCDPFEYILVKNFFFLSIGLDIRSRISRGCLSVYNTFRKGYKLRTWKWGGKKIENTL